jgi:hypothetical protein
VAVSVHIHYLAPAKGRLEAIGRTTAETDTYSHVLVEVRSGERRDPRADVHRDAADVLAEQLDLAGVDASADLEPEGLDAERDRLGTPDATYKKVYDTVLGAQQGALNIIKEGMTGAEADGLARSHGRDRLR